MILQGTNLIQLLPEILVAGELNTLLPLIYCTTAGKKAIAKSILDILLAYQIHGFKPSSECACAIVSIIGEFEESLPKYEIFEHCLQLLLVNIISCSPSDIEKSKTPLPALPSVDDKYYIVSRAMLAGIQDVVESNINLISCARDTCFLLQKAEMVRAMQALSCLESRLNQEVCSSGFSAIKQFIVDANQFFNGIVTLVSSPEIKWEQVIYLANSNLRNGYKW